MNIVYHCHIFFKKHRLSNEYSYSSNLLQFTSHIYLYNIKLPPLDDVHGHLLRINKILCSDAFKCIC